MPEDANSMYLKELLKKAETDNEQARNYERTKLDKEKKNDDNSKTIIAQKQFDTKTNTGRINDEAAQIISVYAKKEKEKPFSNTQSLRDSLATQMQENKELLDYFEGNKSVSKSAKVEELYSLINDAKTATQTDAAVAIPIEVESKRLSELDTIPLKAAFKQEKMFFFGDTQIFDEQPKVKDTASYDSDYEKLTEKITSGEIVIEDEEEDENQIVFEEDEADRLAYTDEEGEPLDETDIKLRLAFNMMDEGRYDIDEFLKNEKEKIKKHKKNKKLNSEKEYEYTSRDQNTEINTMLKKAIRYSRIKLIAVIVFALAIFYLELATKDSNWHSIYWSQGRYGRLYILIDFELLFFIMALMFSNFKNGIFGLLKRKLNTDSILVISFLVTTAYSFVMLLTDPTSAELKLYSLPCAIAFVCAMTINYLNNKKDYHCFRVLASKKTKYAAVELDASAKEADEFYKYLLDNSDLYTVKKTDFISGFFARTKKRAKGEDLLNFLIPSIVVAGAILFGVMFFWKSDIRIAFISFTLLITASVPLASFFMIPLPIIAANRKGARCNSAFIGNAVSEEYADASVMSFADTEVYPAHLVKITSLRTYGDYRIDKIIPELAKVFAYIGGPLEKVFAGTLGDVITEPKAIRLIESAADGICVTIDGTHIFLGKKSYMRRYRFETPADADDELYEKSVGSIMYVVMNESLAAKVYIKYTLNPLFDALLKDMYKAGMCLGIKTLDPNINNELLSNGIRFKKCPIAILKANTHEEVSDECEKIDSGIVSNASLHTFLKMFVVCDKARHVTKSNAIITIASVFLSFFAAVFLSVTGDVSAINSYYMIVLQLIWLLPVWLTSFSL